MPKRIVDPQRVRDARERQDLTIAGLAARCGLSVRAICYIEAGRQPLGRTLHKLARGLDVDVSEILAPCDEQAA